MIQAGNTLLPFKIPFGETLREVCFHELMAMMSNCFSSVGMHTVLEKQNLFEK